MEPHPYVHLFVDNTEIVFTVYAATMIISSLNKQSTCTWGDKRGYPMFCIILAVANLLLVVLRSVASWYHDSKCSCYAGFLISSANRTCFLKTVHFLCYSRFTVIMYSTVGLRTVVNHWVRVESIEKQRCASTRDWRRFCGSVSKTTRNCSKRKSSTKRLTNITRLTRRWSATEKCLLDAKVSTELTLLVLIFKRYW